jgi:deoxyribose-phosphate aldolase
MEKINTYIDHTLLKPDATSSDIIKLCGEAREYQFYAVCVNSSYVALAYQELKDSGVKIAAVVGFPLGACSMETKAYETDHSCMCGADEVDMVLHIGALKEKRYDYVVNDIAAVVSAAKKHDAAVKVILETHLLTKEEIVRACELALEAGADFVKTSTGFSGGGATAEDVKLMKNTVGEAMKVKASGGIKSYDAAVSMIEAGASRLGTSASANIVNLHKWVY